MSNTELLKGTLSTIILRMLSEHPRLYGYEITQLVKERSGDKILIKEGSLYPALHKLESEGLVESYESVENGRPRRYYRITKSGRVALAKDRAEWRKLSRAVTAILGEA